MCCSKQRRQTYCATQYQQRLDLRKLVSPVQVTFQDPSSTHQLDTPGPKWAEYQPHTMAGMIVMGLAMGVHEGVKKIQEKKGGRKAKKAALQMEANCAANGESSAVGSARGHSSHNDHRKMRESEEARLEQESHWRRSSNSECIDGEDAPPTYEEALQHSRRRS